VWHPTWLAICLPIVVIAHIVGLELGRAAKGKSPIAPVLQRLMTLAGLRVAANPLSGVFVTLDEVTVGGTYLVAAAVAAVLLFAPLNANPFIYFQF
jgi:hypothetical protein